MDTTHNQHRFTTPVSFTKNTASGYVTHVQWKSEKANGFGHSTSTMTYGETSLGAEPEVLPEGFISLEELRDHHFTNWVVTLTEDFVSESLATPTMITGQTVVQI